MVDADASDSDEWEDDDTATNNEMGDEGAEKESDDEDSDFRGAITDEMDVDILRTWKGFFYIQMNSEFKDTVIKFTNTSKEQRRYFNKLIRKSEYLNDWEGDEVWYNNSSVSYTHLTLPTILLV